MTFVIEFKVDASNHVCVKHVAPVGIEPTSSESESEILSIEIRSHHLLQNRNLRFYPHPNDPITDKLKRND